MKILGFYVTKTDWEAAYDGIAKSNEIASSAIRQENSNLHAKIIELEDTLAENNKVYEATLSEVKQLQEKYVRLKNEYDGLHDSYQRIKDDLTDLASEAEVVAEEFVSIPKDEYEAAKAELEKFRAERDAHNSRRRERRAAKREAKLVAQGKPNKTS